MTFSHMGYFQAFADALSNTAPVRRVCLIAPLDVVRERLAERARDEGVEIDPWAMRRSQECIEAHKNPAFGIPIDATRPPSEITAQIREIIGRS